MKVATYDICFLMNIYLISALIPGRVSLLNAYTHENNAINIYAVNAIDDIKLLYLLHYIILPLYDNPFSLIYFWSFYTWHITHIYID